MNPPDSPGSGWRIAPEGLFLGGLVRISFQRCLRPTDGIHHSPPQSLGALSLGTEASGELLLPLANDEAFWLGLSPLPRGAVYLFAIAETEARDRLNVCTGRPWPEDSASHFTIPGATAINGIFRDAGTVWALQRVPAGEAPVCKRMSLRVIMPQTPHEGEHAAAAVWIRLVDYVNCSGATGLTAPAPLDPDAGYGGWLLP